MNKRWKIAILITAAVLAIGTGIGVVAAKNAVNPANPQSAFYAGETVDQFVCGANGPMTRWVTPQLATLLGTTVTDLQAQLTSGKTLAEIATAKGVSQDQLIQTMMAQYNDQLALMVKYGRLTQAQADTLKEQAKTRLQTVVTSKITPGTGWNGAGGARGWCGGTPNNETGAVPGAGYGMMRGYGGGMMGRW